MDAVNSNDAWLHNQFSDREWFDSVGRDQFGRTVIYVKYMSLEVLTLTEVPLQSNGRVLVHFATSKNVSADQFKVNTKSTSLPEVSLAKETIDEPEGDSIESADLLCQELDRLEKLCNSNTLQDIFYEIHDGPNAVTNLSARYPEVTLGMQALYNTYGFDVIYEELDG